MIETKKKIGIWGVWLVVSIAIGFIAYGCSGLTVFQDRVYSDSSMTYVVEFLIRVIVYAIVVTGNILILVKLNSKRNRKKLGIILQFVVALLDLKWVAFGSMLFYTHFSSLLEKGEIFSYFLMTYYLIGVVLVIVIPNIVWKIVEKNEE